MTARRPILRVGLTGGIASGKSTVGAMLAQLGAYVLDADALALAATSPGGSAFRAVVERFGAEILDAAGRIDRTVLGRRVFDDAAARRDLEAIVHPAVRDAASQAFAERLTHGTEPLFVFDAALLVETGAYRDFDRLIVTRCRRETQIERLIERNGLNRHEALARIEAQAPLERKLAVADHVIDTDGSIDETRRQVGELFDALVDPSNPRR